MSQSICTYSLEISNEEKKRLLKADKVRLEEIYDQIRQQALEVEQGKTT